MVTCSADWAAAWQVNFTGNTGKIPDWWGEWEIREWLGVRFNKNPHLYFQPHWWSEAVHVVTFLHLPIRSWDTLWICSVSFPPAAAGSSFPSTQPPGRALYFPSLGAKPSLLLLTLEDWPAGRAGKSSCPWLCCSVRIWNAACSFVWRVLEQNTRLLSSCRTWHN